MGKNIVIIVLCVVIAALVGWQMVHNKGMNVNTPETPVVKEEDDVTPPSVESEPTEVIGLDELDEEEVSKDPDDVTGSVSEPEPSIEGEPLVEEREPEKLEDVERVRSRILKGKFASVGRGEDAKWGVKGVMNFQYTAFIIAKSEIQSVDTLPTGYIKLVELRTFEKVQDSLTVSDIDFQLNLQSLPLDIFSKVFDVALETYETISGDVITSEIAKANKETGVGLLKSIDGISLRKILGFAGVEVPADIETYLERFNQAKVRQAIGSIRKISGKAYRITWYQKASGQPMLVTFENPDGSFIEDDEERMLLKRVNSFIDSHVIPNTKCVVGDSWKVPVESVQEILDPYVDGKYTGHVKMERVADGEDGTWNLNVLPGQVEIRTETGNVTGNLDITSGYAKAFPKDASLLELFLEGTAHLTSLSRHHLLFTATQEGDCKFQGRIISTPISVGK